MTVVEAVDLGPPKRDGYQKLSDFMFSFPEHAIFRKFTALNVQNLLYLQAEITRLEAELQEIAAEDRQAKDSSRCLYHRSWWELSQASSEKHDNLQWEKVLEIRRKLQEYNISLLRMMEIGKLSQPRHHDLNVLRRWLQAADYGNFFLRGTEAQVWDQSNVPDLLTLSDKRHEQDIFSGWLAEKLIKFLHRSFLYRIKKPLPGDIESGLTHYADTSLSSFANVLNTILASLLPTVSIFVLYFVTRPLVRLAAIMVFSAVFSTTLAVFTKARRIEIFAATAAFASVQVVFVGGVSS